MPTHTHIHTPKRPSPAVFPPSLSALPPPALEQFDLDEAFATPPTRLARLTHKCRGDDTAEDLAFYVQEAATVSA